MTSKHFPPAPTLKVSVTSVTTTRMLTRRGKSPPQQAISGGSQPKTGLGGNTSAKLLSWPLIRRGPAVTSLPCREPSSVCSPEPPRLSAPEPTCKFGVLPRHSRITNDCPKES